MTTANLGVDAGYTESLVRDGKIDFVVLGRQMFADPHWANKVAAGDINHIIPCIGCNECSLRVQSGRRVGCAVNPLTGKEKEYQLVKANTFRRVLVIGGDAAGMTAAITAAEAGHSVTLWEKRSQLGGHMAAAGAPEFKIGLRNFIQYGKLRLAELGVKIVFLKKASAEDIIAEDADLVVLSIGGKPIVPPLPGLDGANVVTTVDYLRREAFVGDSVIVIGGGHVGAETALELANHGKKVTLVEMQDKLLAEEMYIATRQSLFKNMDEPIYSRCLDTSSQKLRRMPVW